jgi:molybdopterin molybdotransferase
MISVVEAQEKIKQWVNPLEAEAVPLGEAQGRVLRETIVSPEDLPPFDRSAMDGYAIDQNDVSK